MFCDWENKMYHKKKNYMSSHLYFISCLFSFSLSLDTLQRQPILSCYLSRHGWPHQWEICRLLWRSGDFESILPSLCGIIKSNNGNDQLICHLGLIVLNAPILLDDAFKTLSQAKWISVSLIKIDDLEMSQQSPIRTWNPEESIEKLGWISWTWLDY